MRHIRSTTTAFAALLALTGCKITTVNGQRDAFAEAPLVTATSPTGANLANLPEPQRPIDITIYNFPDLTGQNKPNDNLAEYSRAVTQGATAFAIDALRSAGGGKWFSVVERAGLTNLLQERQLIRQTRAEFDGDKARPLPPIRFAGLIVEGGIIAYDANTVTGGIGARYLGIGGDAKHRRDVVTVGMRIVSVQSGQVLNSVTVTKTIYSTGLSGGAFKYVGIARLLEVEAGVTRNEPTQLAVREAIELAVYATVMEGAKKGLWSFKDKYAGQRLIQEYIERDTTPVPVEPKAPPPLAPTVSNGRPQVPALNAFRPAITPDVTNEPI